MIVSDRDKAIVDLANEHDFKGITYTINDVSGMSRRYVLVFRMIVRGPFYITFLPNL